MTSKKDSHELQFILKIRQISDILLIVIIATKVLKLAKNIRFNFLIIIHILNQFFHHN